MGSDLFGIKVSPDGSSWSTSVTFDLTGRAIFGDTVARTISGAVNPRMQVHGSTVNDSSFGFTRWQNTTAGPTMYLAQSRGADPGHHVRPQTGDILATYSFQASDGANFLTGADVRSVTEGDWSTNAARKAGVLVRTRDDLLQNTAYFGDNGRVELPRIGTTASGANAFLDGGNSNRLLRSTSSERYKRNIEPLETARSDAILSLEPIWYRSTAPADRPDWSWYGLIAEDVAAIEPRLVHYGYHEDDYQLVPEEVEEGAEPSYRRVLKRGAELKPDGVQYDRLAVLLLDIVKRHEAQIAELEGRLAPETPGDTR